VTASPLAGTALLCLVVFSSTICVGAFGPLLPEIARAQGLPDWQLGLLAGSFGFARMAADLPVGALATRRLASALTLAPITLLAGMLLLAQVGVHTSPWRVALDIVIIGAGLGMTFPLTFAAVQQSPIAGHWEGAIKLPTGALNFSVDFTVASDGKLAAAITIPQQGAKDLPLANVGFDNGEVTFGLPNVPGDPKFRGKLSTDGQKIEGTFSQGGADLPCSIERKADPVAAAKEALTGFDDVVTDAMKKFEVPGMAIAIVKDKEVIYAKGFGLRDVEKQLPVTADTIFAIGSSSKAFTTFVLGTLVDEGKIEWDKPVRNYIPWAITNIPATAS